MPKFEQIYLILIISAKDLFLRFTAPLYQYFIIFY